MPSRRVCCSSSSLSASRQGACWTRCTPSQKFFWSPHPADESENQVDFVYDCVLTISNQVEFVYDCVLTIPSQAEFIYDCVFRYPARLSSFMTVSSPYPSQVEFIYDCVLRPPNQVEFIWLCPQTTQPGSVYLWLCLQQTLIVPCLTTRNILSQISLPESAILPKGGVGVGGGGEGAGVWSRQLYSGQP